MSNKVLWLALGAAALYVGAKAYAKRGGCGCGGAAAGAGEGDDDQEDDDGPGYGASVLQRVQDGTTHVIRSVLDLGRSAGGSSSSADSGASSGGCGCGGAL